MARDEIAITKESILSWFEFDIIDLIQNLPLYPLKIMLVPRKQVNNMKPFPRQLFNSGRPIQRPCPR